MNDNELAKIPTLDYFEADLLDWAAVLMEVLRTIDLAELTHADSYYTDARKNISAILDQVAQAEHFIAVKRKAFVELTADVAALFEAEQARQLAEREQSSQE